MGPLHDGIQCLFESLMGWILPLAWPISAAHILSFSTPILLMRRKQPRRWVKASMTCVPPTALISTFLSCDDILVGGWMWLLSLVLVGCEFLLVCRQAESSVKSWACEVA